MKKSLHEIVRRTRGRDTTNSILTISEFANVLKQSDNNGLQVLDALRAQGDATGTGFAQLLAIIGLDTTMGDAGNNTLRGSNSVHCLQAANNEIWREAA